MGSMITSSCVSGWYVIFPCVFLRVCVCVCVCANIILGATLLNTLGGGGNF